MREIYGKRKLKELTEGKKRSLKDNETKLLI